MPPPISVYTWSALRKLGERSMLPEVLDAGPHLDYSFSFLSPKREVTFRESIERLACSSIRWRSRDWRTAAYKPVKQRHTRSGASVPNVTIC